MASDDSTGKSKAFESKARFQYLVSFFLIGLCVGVVVGGRMYVQRVKSGGTQASGRQLSVLHSSGSSKVSLPSREDKSEDLALALDFSKPARNDLEELLRKVRCGHCGSACRPPQICIVHAERIRSDPMP